MADKPDVLVVRSARTLKLGSAVLELLRQHAGRRVGGAGAQPSFRRRDIPTPGGKP